MRHFAPRRLLARLRKALFRRVPAAAAPMPHMLVPVPVHDRYAASLSGDRHRPHGLHG